jgi:hypothetical protein
MISKFIYIIFFIALVLGSVYITRVLLRRFRINRWIVGFLAPFILIVPSIVFKEINTVVWNILIVIFCVLCIMFFEITRTLLENNEIKGVAKYKKK